MPTSQLLPSATLWRGINTKNSVITGSGVTLKDIIPPFGLVPTSVIHSRLRRSRTSDPLLWLSPEEKQMESNQLFLICIWWCIWSWLIWVSVKIMMSLFFSAKLTCQILLQGISDATNNVIYHTITTEKSEKKSSLIQFHVLPCN